MKTPSQKHDYLKLLFLVLFLLGLTLFGLIGDSLKILYVAIPLLLPYIFVFIYEYFRDTNNPTKEFQYNEIQVEKLLKTGIPITINFERAIKDITELSSQRNEDIEILQEFLFSFKEIVDNKTEEVFSLVELKYKIGKKDFLKKIILPFSKQSTIFIKKIQKSTTVYYNEESPHQSIVDLQFIEKYT
ncbi:hypothetical protein [Chryseobacterium sp. BIGb0232]|uniref:hypothetical protein n=1 Tax=Chryseobacterium sp. BIGb0232 TaxID=2940598 RepID=UPI000FB39C64|nr:hypothetical protein [Chryseobacterium sp. BIGb0232]MCS4302886.1 hypothetical protein [Chryseobacterium sp. BIGb0232]ROS17538.1 hypothetical protein EDF65_1910 [Chryseobacterium nakagawai]